MQRRNSRIINQQENLPERIHVQSANYSLAIRTGAQSHSFFPTDDLHRNFFDIHIVSSSMHRTPERYISRFARCCNVPNENILSALRSQCGIVPRPRHKSATPIRHNWAPGVSNIKFLPCSNSAVAADRISGTNTVTTRRH